jgi:ABC-type multidrug transport system fused ATPase/permease subunit
MIRDIRRGWALLGRRERRRLGLVAGYGILIAALDTIALLVLFVLINVLLEQPAKGFAVAVVPADYSSEDDRYRVALILLCLAATLFVIRSLLSVLGLWLTLGAANAAQGELVARLLGGHARASHLVRIERNSAETLRTVLGSVDQVMIGIVASSVSLVGDAAIVAAVVLGLVLSSPLVALTVSLYFLALVVVWVRVVRGGLAWRGALLQKLTEERFRFILQGIAAAKELQLRGRSVFYADEAAERTRGLLAASRGVMVVNGSLRYLLETALVIGAIVVVLVAGAAGGGAAALPAVGLVLAGAFRLLPALNRVLFLVNQVQYNGPALDFVEAEVETYCATGAAVVPASADQVKPLRLQRELALDAVTFRYPTRRSPALRNVRFTVRPGEAVGLVGPTGSGKSTLLDILLGLIEPDSGRVTVDGMPVVECREGWQRSIGYVPQDVFLVDDTLRANVALGWRGDDIDEEAVLEGVRLADLEDVVAELPDGLETIVGERGVRLSGGQRQRVGLARALYVRPTVLILDEATSNLDTATERRIVETLAALHGSMTMVVVTHRVATVRDCDRIVYLEAGTVGAEGTFEELARLLPAFGVREPLVRTGAPRR